MINIDGVKNTNILLIDNNKDYINLIENYFNKNGLNIITTDKSQEALQICEKQKIDIIVLDYFIKDIECKKFITELREFNHKAIVILQAEENEEGASLEAFMQLDVQGYFDKARGAKDLCLMILSTIKTTSLLLYKNNPDTYNIEYSFMVLGNEDILNEDGIEIDLGFDDEVSVFEIGEGNASELETEGFIDIAVTNVSSKEEYEKIKAEKMKNSMKKG